MDTSKRTLKLPGGLNNGRILQTVFSVAIVLATLFTVFPLNALSASISSRLSLLLTPQPEGFLSVPTSQQALRIGIVAGHWGNDSGAVCEDGTREVDINLEIATFVKQKATALGYSVDLLEEFDPRLTNYQAVLLISIHNDSCEYKNDLATGFKVAASGNIDDPNRVSRLTACLRDRYQRITGLQFHQGSITEDMTAYHAFNEINPFTVAAIIETGFLNLDYVFLTQHPDAAADGIVAGILCYMNTEDVGPDSAPTGSP